MHDCAKCRNGKLIRFFLIGDVAGGIACECLKDYENPQGNCNFYSQVSTFRFVARLLGPKRNVFQQVGK